MNYNLESKYLQIQVHRRKEKSSEKGEPEIYLAYKSTKQSGLQKGEQDERT